MEAHPPLNRISNALSVDDLPVEITSAEWRTLEGRLEWSPSHHAFLFRPEMGAGLELETPELPSSAGTSAEGAQGASSPPPPTRPRTFDDFVGQGRVVGNLLLAARAAGARGESLGHVLLSGQAGLGKTTIARLLAAASGSGIQEVVAGHIADPHQLLSLLARLRKGEFLFIDEVHGLGTACEEALYPALEDSRVDVVLRDRSWTRTIRVRLEAFTLVGATTRLGALSEPFRARFRLRERLEPYGEEELAEIVARAAARLGSPVTAAAAREVARRSRGTPREAIQLLERARDIVQVSAAPEVSPMSQVSVDPEPNLAHVGQMHHLSSHAATAQISDLVKTGKMNSSTYDNSQAAPKGKRAAGSAARQSPVIRAAQVVEASHVAEAARRAGIDERGLGREEREIVRLLLCRGKPMGLEAIASRLGLDLETLRDVHEPWLERAGLVERTVHGRIATDKARAWYGASRSKAPPGAGGQGNEDEDEGPSGSEGQAGPAGPAGPGGAGGPCGSGGPGSNAGPVPNGGRRSIPILRLPFRFG